MDITIPISPLGTTERAFNVTRVAFLFTQGTPEIQLTGKVIYYLDGREIKSLEQYRTVSAVDTVKIDPATFKRVDKVLNPNAIEVESGQEFEGKFYEVPEGEDLLVWPEGTVPEASAILGYIQNSTFNFVELLGLFVSNLDSYGDFNE